MTEDQFTKLFKYIEKRFDAMDVRFDENKNDHADIRGAVVELGGSCATIIKNWSCWRIR